MLIQSVDAAPAITMQAKRFTKSGYFKPRVLHKHRYATVSILAI